MKKFTTLLLTAGMLLSMNTIAFASSDVKIKVNGTLLSDAQAILKDGSTLLPVRSVSTALGGEVLWDNDTKTASIDKDGTAVAITIGKKEITINGKKQTISTPAQIVNGRTYVPLRALGEALECDITWVNATKTVEISQVDPSEYKAWFEVNEQNNLYIKTNINSQKWDGHSILICYNMINKNNPNHYEFDTEGGKGSVSYSCSSFLSHPWTDEVSGIKSTEIYIFKGIDTKNEFWDLNDRYGDRKKALAALSDQIAYQTVLNQRIYFHETNQPITFTDFEISYDKANQTETYTASVKEPLLTEGRYGLYCQGHRNHRFSAISVQKDHLTKTREIHHFNGLGASATFHITYCTCSMDNNGNITIAKTISNGLPYRFPLYY